MRNFDVVVIGAGAAGLSVAYGAARLGVRVALVERGEMGGECLNVGCVPSKALLAATRRGADWPGAKAEVRRAVAAIAPVDSQERYEGLGAVVLRGAARFVGRREVAVGDEVLRARWVVVATGSRPVVPSFLAGLPHVTNETVWDLAALPARLAIIGGGPMALEMADACAGLGAAVSVISAGPCLPREDSELVAPVLAALRGKGVRFYEGRAVGARPDGPSGVAVQVEGGEEVAADMVLVAAGRFVEADGLGLAAAGITAGPAGIRVDRALRAIGNRRVFAAGDAADPAGIGPRRFTHIAGAHASVIMRQISFRLPAKVSAVPPVRVIYTAPELAQVGQTLDQAGSGARALVWPFAENDRAIAESDTAGLVKLVIDKRGRLRGAGITGPNAGEMISLYALAIAQRTKLSALAALVLPYPTRGEAGKRAAGAYFAEKLFGQTSRFLVKLISRLP
jgi:pyruvate/2-oxoglutarate dehydrogenase complex dihydrolipoamide dehydrogenase (E3) component